MVNQNKKILAVLPLLGHPRDSKRISMLQDQGFDVEAVAFERDYHSGRMPSCITHKMGKIANGQYLRRIFKMIFALPILRKYIKKRDIVYCSGADMAFMALVSGLGLKKPIIVEIGDIREIQVSEGFTGMIFRKIDKWLIDKCSLLVATTSSFVDVYYRQWLKALIPAVVIENKLERSIVDLVGDKRLERQLQGKPLVDRPLRIGYFGGLRCRWSWEVLKAFAIKKPNDVEIILAGYPMDPPNLEELVENYDNIHYKGQYKSPQDLPSLYNSVDIIWGCYQPIGKNDWNLRWARPNRFYESCFFQVPIISRDGSCDAVDVKEYNIGLIIKEAKVQDVVNKLNEISNQDIEIWNKNLSNIPEYVYMYTNEAETLKNALEKL